ncbi:hypothetical protein COO60DRAFT_1548381 [Scenedesmus sp. NREL 46B-D3]|nr:hypothetical protein COO60DRAFT_1548381 [Scenedesmus sp. NREL 46B-D3]
MLPHFSLLGVISSTWRVVTPAGPRLTASSLHAHASIKRHKRMPRAPHSCNCMLPATTTTTIQPSHHNRATEHLNSMHFPHTFVHYCNCSADKSYCMLQKSLMPPGDRHARPAHARAATHSSCTQALSISLWQQ